MDPTKVANDVGALVQAVPALHVRDISSVNDVLKPHDAVLCLEGLLPATFRAALYNVPVKIFITSHYPFAPPICFVVPTPDVMLNPRHPGVQSTGLCHPPLSLRWHYNLTLLDFATSLISVFSELPPILEKPAAPPVPSTFPSDSLLALQDQHNLLLRQRQLDLQMQAMGRDQLSNAFNLLNMSGGNTPNLGLSSGSNSALTKSASAVYNNHLDNMSRSRAASDSSNIAAAAASSSHANLTSSKSDYNLPGGTNPKYDMLTSDAMANFDAFRMSKPNAFEPPHGDTGRDGGNIGSGPGTYPSGGLNSSQNGLGGYGRLTTSNPGDSDVFKDDRLRKSHSLPPSAQPQSSPYESAVTPGVVGDPFRPPTELPAQAAKQIAPYAHQNSLQNSQHNVRDLAAPTGPSLRSSSARDLRLPDGDGGRESQQQSVSRAPGDNAPLSLTSSGTFSAPSLVSKSSSNDSGSSSLFSSALFHPSTFASDTFASGISPEKLFLSKSNGNISPRDHLPEMSESEFFKADPNVPIPPGMDEPLEPPEESTRLAPLKEDREDDARIQTLEGQVKAQKEQIKLLNVEKDEIQAALKSEIDELNRSHAVTVSKLEREVKQLSGEDLDGLDLAFLRDLLTKVKESSVKIERAIEAAHAAMEQESQKHEEARLCAVCLENEKDTLLLPCSHLVICESCSKRDLKLCPVCRKKILKMKRVYL